jgi:hypothetical protein
MRYVRESLHIVDRMSLVESGRAEERERSQALRWRAKKFYMCVLKLQLFPQEWIRRTTGSPTRSAEQD